MNKILQVDTNITLELPTLEDVEKLYTLVDINREHLRLFLDWVDNTVSPENTKQNIQERLDGYTKGSSASFIIKQNNVIIGSAGYPKLKKKNKYGEIGYWIDKSHEGKGIMSKCVKTLIEYGFNELDLHRILIRCNNRNHKSSAIPKRFGFILEGVLREDRFDGKEYSSTEVYGLLKDEY